MELLRERLLAARLEIRELERKLVERKLVERAKGLLQSHYNWSEEEAYYHLRRTSRQQRIPMGVVAQRVIEIGKVQEVEPERMTA
jgi:response regulator NasT